MKAYIIITNTIYGFGGGQLLTLRKAKFLTKLGYNVIIAYKARYGTFKLEKEFGLFNCFYVPEFSKPYNFVSKMKRNAAIDKIRIAIGEYERGGSLIESHDTDTCVWGEVLSKNLNIPHVLYLIVETNMNRLHYYPYRKFYLYKLYRNEFWGCNTRGLALSFRKPMLDFKDNFVDVAFDENEVPQTSTPRFGDAEEKNSNTLVITTITRLDKAYLKQLISTLDEYSQENKDIKIEFVVVGGTVYSEVQRDIDRIAQFINEKKGNLHITKTGYMVPGKDLYEYTDIFIGTGTAAINAISQKCITIPYNSFTNKTPGFIGIEAKNFAYSEEGCPEYDIKETIDRIIAMSESEKEFLVNSSYSFYKKNYSIEGTWEKTKEMLNRIPMDNQTYSFKFSKIYILFDISFYLLSKIRDYFFR